MNLANTINHIITNTHQHLIKLAYLLTMEEAAAGSEPLPSSPSSEARAELSSPEPDVLLGADGEEVRPSPPSTPSRAQLC